MIKFKKITSLFLAVTLIAATTGIAYGADTAYTSTSLGGTNVKIITVNIKSPNIKPVLLQANNQICSTQPLSAMASAANAVAAINGTYFEAYGGLPVPWGSIIKDGKVLHSSDSGAVFGITNDNKFMVDNLKFKFESYADGKLANTVWRINHPSVANEPEAITAYTPEYGNVTVPAGAKAVKIADGKIIEFATATCGVPANGFVILFNPGAVKFMYDRYAIGMTCELKTEFKPARTSAADWQNVAVGLGAGPSLIINGQVTANGESEGFFEAKINKNKAGRSFIGANSEGKILMGSIGSATLKEAAAICQSLGLVNAMCLDGGGSISLYHKQGNMITQNGRAVNNGLGFVITSGTPAVNKPANNAKPTANTILVDGANKEFDAYNISNNNYFKLRDVATAVNGSDKQFEVSFDQTQNAINLISNKAYVPVGGEMAKGDGTAKVAKLSTATICKDGKDIKLTAYTINNNNYFKLRDLAKAFDIGVTYDKATGNIGIDTTIPYTE